MEVFSFFIETAERQPTRHRAIGSLVGRWFFSHYPPEKNGYLNLGCGANYEKDYCNADFFPFNFVRKLLGRKPKPMDWALDLCHPLKCKDEFFRGVFFEHTFEHLDVWDGQRLLKELHRIIKRGGTLRITVPSLEAYVKFYRGEPQHPNFEQWKLKGEAFWNLTHNWGHKAVYDGELLSKLLRDAGFTDVKTASFRTGRDPALLLDSQARDWETLYVEGTRP
jgi:hypothetical protein